MSEVWTYSKQLIGRRDAATALLYLNVLHAVCHAVVSLSVR